MIRSLVRDVGIAAFVTLAVVATVSLAPPPGAGRLDAEGHDFAHVLVFGVLGLFVARTLRRLPAALAARTRVIVFTLTLGLAFGVFTELAQQYLGGRLSRGDVARDLLGTALGICAAFALERGTAPRLRRLLWGTMAIGLLGASLPLADTLLDYRARAALFPVLIDPGANRGHAFVGRGELPLTVDPLPPQVAEEDSGPDTPATADPEAIAVGAAQRTRTAAPLALRARLDLGAWPGVTLAEPMPDWRGYGRLALELANAGDAPLRLSFRVNDQAHDNRFEDRFNADILLPPRSRRRIVYPLADIESAPRGRRMNLAEIEKVVVFHPGPAAGRDFYLLRLELER